jgi:menaquinone-dependent protoporphyrinogen oxidase
MVLVAYASKHGATEGIAQAIAARLRERGLQADAQAVDQAGDPGSVDALVLGSAVYVGSWMNEAVAFAERNATALADTPVWIFSSGPLGDEVQDEEEQPRQLDDLRSWLSPIDHQVFFGALDKSALGFGERMMVKAVKAPDGDFRDWDAIAAWADRIADTLA